VIARQAACDTIRSVFDALIDPEEEAAWPPPRPSDRRPAVWQSVHGAYHAMRIRVQRAVVDVRLEASEALVLAYLLSSPGCSPGEVRLALGFHRSTLASLLTRLERRGYIRRGAPPFDGRRLMLDLTPTGQRAAEHTRALLLDLEEELEGWVSPHERRGAAAVFAACQAMVGPDEWMDD
jgi:MarR family transcriptional regulator, organic hydroperoxide resistance regulator